MTTSSASTFPFRKKDLKHLDPNFKIEAIVADGMWYSLPKWRKLSKVTEKEINQWVEDNLATGYLLQSATGAKSFRISHESVLDWHERNGLEVGEQIFDFIFPARVWDNMTEIDGFLNAPLREIGVVTFDCERFVADEVRESLLGIARVREVDPGRYKAYCLSSEYIKPIIREIFDKYTVAEASRIYSRRSSMRRELVDFSNIFAHHLISFYRQFAKSLIKKEMETIKIYIPEAQDQDSQIISWVITAIEKFDESSSVPFSGYLNSVLKRWPYDLPNQHLGQDLSSYQRARSRAVNELRAKSDTPDLNFSAAELADAMGMRLSDFADFEEKHHVWIKTKNASSLVWDESSEEKGSDGIVGALGGSQSSISNLTESHKISCALIEAALKTSLYDDAFFVISQVGADDIDLSKVKEASEDFIYELGSSLGLV